MQRAKYANGTVSIIKRASRLERSGLAPFLSISSYIARTTLDRVLYHLSAKRQARAVFFVIAEFCKCVAMSVKTAIIGVVAVNMASHELAAEGKHHSIEKIQSNEHSCKKAWPRDNLDSG